MHTPIYNQIGQNYNATRQADPYIVDRLSDHLKPVSDLRYLDIGCGTGNYTIALAKRGLRLSGVEPSVKMLDVARLHDQDIEWLLGSAEQIPVYHQTFAGAIAVLTVHHWLNLTAAFNEISRVLMPGSRLVIFTASPGQMQGYWLNHYFPQMLASSIKQMPSLDVIQNALATAGFEILDMERYFIRGNLTDKFLYAGKDAPEIYFDAAVRAGISSFAALANVNEVEPGLKKLKNDMDSGEFEDVKKRFDNDLGDYLFIIATT